MIKKFVSILIALIALQVSPSLGLPSQSESKTAFARGVVTGQIWAIDYPDFAQALVDEKWNFILKAINGNVIGAYDNATLILSDSTGKELINDSGYSSGANGTIEFSDNISGSDFNGIDLSSPFKGTIKVSREYDSKLKDAVISVSIPVSTFPKRPASAKEYVSIVTAFPTIAFPQDCTSTEFQYKVTDPFEEISNIKFSILDSSGLEVGSASSYFSEAGLQKEDIQLCPYSLEKAVAPFTFSTTIIFKSATGKLALNEKITFPLASKKDEALAKANSLGDFCAKGTSTKVVATGVNCPSGFKKINFSIPSEAAWNSLTRMPQSQKGKNYVVYACVAQFDANTGGSKFRGYASPVQQKYYFLDGVNAIFTGSAKQLLALSEKTAFIAKVTVSGGVSYTTFGGKTSVPALSIRQFKAIGSC